MTCRLTWTSRDGARRETDVTYPDHAEAALKVGSAMPRFDQGDVLTLTKSGRVLLRLRCGKPPAAQVAASHLPRHGFDD